MGCRIGITTNLEARKTYWAGIYRGFRDWQVMGGPFSKTKAQAEEDRLAAAHRCEAHAGGDDPDYPGAQWYVYGFNHDGKK